VPKITTAKIVLAIFALIAALVVWRYSPPTPRGDDAPKDEFSAARARLVQEKLVGDGGTRWIGTPGNEKGRAVIAQALVDAGWKVETQSVTSCTFYGICTPISNIVATLEGAQPGLPGVLMSAHHDSVGAGPGASDDGVGVATIVETARAIAAGPKPKRTVVALLTDGEEAGLTGAEAFVRSHPLASKVRATVNVDARGSTGPSSMFETSKGNAWLAAIMAARLPRPVTTSLFYEVYRRMPNDTDFSVTKTIAGGVNFANIGRIEHYHTPLDNMAHADPGTLQHHGDHVLAMVRAFADSDAAPQPGDGDAVWFDVLAFGIVQWPENWSIILSVLAFAFVLRQAIRWKTWDRGLAVFPAMLAVGLAVAFLAFTALGYVKAVPAPWIAHPGPALVAVEVGALAAAIQAARLVATSPRALWAGTWLVWAILGIVVSKIAPGASYLFIVPALAAGLAGMASSFNIACAVPAVIAGVLVLSLRTALYDALGFAVAPLLAFPTVLLATTMAPMLVAIDHRVPRVLGGLAAAGFLVALAVPKYTVDHPQRVNVELRQDEKDARVFVDTGWGGKAAFGHAPDAILAAAGAGTMEARPLPWMRSAPYGTVPLLPVAGPTIEITSAIDEGGSHRIKGRIQSKAPLVAIWFPARRTVEVKVAGRFAYPRVMGEGSLLAIVAPSGVPIEIDAKGEGQLSFELADKSPGLPPGTKAEAAAQSRNAVKEACPSQDGDVTIVSRKLSL
jgi:hypothetical protein